MTAYDLIQRLAQFPPDTRVVHAVDWSDDVVLADFTDVPEQPALALSCTRSIAPGNPYRVELATA